MKKRIKKKIKKLKKSINKINKVRVQKGRKAMLHFTVRSELGSKISSDLF